MTDILFDNRACELGEGPLWHPLREQLYWFDITGCKLLTRTKDGPHSWSFDEEHSAAGWVDQDTLMIASASGLWRFDLGTGTRTLITPLERDNPITRSNDGRADPWGGFWIGTMGRNAEAGAGAIYRFYQGQLRQLFSGITVSNAICFAPNWAHAYYTDTMTAQVMRVALDRAGWPEGQSEVAIDTTDPRLNPDGAVVAADGTLWVAQWGASRVAQYDASGQMLRTVDVPARHSSCPAFGGADLRDLYVTSARQGVRQDVLESQPTNGMTFCIKNVAQGLAEPQVRL